jgi:hypothetical protein
LIEPVEVHFQWRPQSRDPNDEMVLEAAINDRARPRREASFADVFRSSARSIRIVVASRPDVVVRLSRKRPFRLLISSHNM